MSKAKVGFLPLPVGKMADEGEKGKKGGRKGKNPIVSHRRTVLLSQMMSQPCSKG